MKLLFLFFWILSVPFTVTFQAESPKPDKLMLSADSLAQSGFLDSAASLYHQAYLSYELKEQYAAAVTALEQEADIYFNIRRSNDAIGIYQFMLDSLSKNLSDSLRGEVLYKTGISYARLANFGPALENMKRSAQVRSQSLAAEDMVLATTYHMLGRLYFVVGDYRQSLRYQLSFLDIIRANYPEGHPRQAEAYQYVGLSYSRLYEHELALQYYQQTLDILLNQESINRDGVASTYNNMGLVFGRRGEIEKELEHLQKALSLRDGNNSAKATNLHNIGRAYFDLKDYSKSQKYLRRAASMKKQLVGPEHSTVAKSYQQIAILYREQQQYDSALYYLNKALAIDNKNYDRSGISVSDLAYELGKTHQALGRLDSSLMYFQKSIAAIVQDYDSSQLNMQPTAEQVILEKRTLSRNLDAKSRTLYDYYRQDKDINKLKLAYACSESAVDFTEQVYYELNDQSSFSFLAEKANEIYEHHLATSLLLYQKAPAPKLLQQAFAVMERNKARLLLYNIAESRWKNSVEVDDSLLTTESELKAQIAYYEKLRFEEYSSPQTDSLRLAEIKNELFSMNNQLKAVREGIRAENPQKNGLLYQTQYASLDNTQKLLSENELILEYFEGKENIYGMAISRDSAEFIQLAKSERFREVTDQLISGLRAKDYPRYAQSAQQTYQQLLASFAAIQSNKINRLIIIPDGQLGYIPFEALLSKTPPTRPEYHRLPYLIRNYTLTYQYSASLLGQEEQTLDYSQDFLGYAPGFSQQSNPLLATRSAGDRQLASALEELPYAREEVLSIADLLKGQAYTASQATEAHFKQTAAQARMLHLASHTLIDDENPLYSRLVFAQDDASDEDGLLHTYELYNMNLPAEMVALSACNTGLGKIKAGEGIISLARGFMYAGVSNVLMSLWAVSDRSTSQLMQYFYESLDEGEEKAEALRNAKLRYLENADANTAAPYYWSGFVLVSGEHQAQASLPDWFYLVLITGVSISISVFFIKKKFA